MPRTAKEFEEELLGWPEEGGFRYERLYEILAELEARIEETALKAEAVARLRAREEELVGLLRRAVRRIPLEDREADDLMNEIDAALTPSAPEGV